MTQEAASSSFSASAGSSAAAVRTINTTDAKSISHGCFVINGAVRQHSLYQDASSLAFLSNIFDYDFIQDYLVLAAWQCF